LTNHFEQSTATGLILFVVLQMLCELSDAICQDGDLHFGRTSVFLVAMKILDRLCLDFFRERHDVCFLSVEIMAARAPHYAGLHVHSLPPKRAYRRAGPVTGEDYTRKL
jgi:hypothetical protein